jgi:hypothetical protein
MEQSDVRDDLEDDSIVIDCDVFCVTSPARDLEDKKTRHTTAVSTAGTSEGLHYKDGNFPARSVNWLESTVMTAREALSALDPAEKGMRSPQEGIQLSQKTMDPDFAFEPHRDPAPAWYSTHENYQTNVISGSPSHSSPVSSVRLAATVEGLAQAASLKPTAGPNTSQNDSSSRESPLSILQTTNRDATNTSLNPIVNNGHAISSSNPHQTENSFAKSNSISRMVNPSPANAPKTSQAERRYYSLTAQHSAQVSQTLSPPNHQPLFADGVQSNPSNQSGKVITSLSNPDVISEKRYSPTPSEKNSSQNSGDSRQATAQQPPLSGRTDQDRDTESTRVGTSSPPPNPQYRPSISYFNQTSAPPPISTQNQKQPTLAPTPVASNQNQNQPPPPLPPISPQNRWSNGPPPPPSHPSSQNQGPPPPPPPPPYPVPTQNRSYSGPPPPSIATQSEEPSSRPPQPPLSLNPQYQRPPAPPPQPPPSTNAQHQTAFAPPFCLPPPPPLQIFSTQAQSPLNVIQYQAPIPSSSQSTFTKQLIPPRSLPALARDLGYPSVQPEPTQHRGPPPPSPSTQYHGPPASPAQCQASPSHLSASTQYQSPYPVDASNSVLGSPPLQFPSLGQQQQPSPSPWNSSQHVGQPPPPTQNLPVGPVLDPSDSASGITFPNSRPHIAGQQFLETTEIVWKKFNEMVIIHVPIDVQTDANRINSEVWTYIFPAGTILRQTVAELFQWVSNILNTTLPSQLVLEFMNIHSEWGNRMTLHQGDTMILEAVKATAWEYFRKIAGLDPAVASVKILITPYFWAASGSVGENMHQKSQQLHYANTAWNTPSDQPSYAPLLNQTGSSIASDSASRPSAFRPRGPPPIGPPQQSQSNLSRSLTPDTINSYRGPSNPAPSSMTIPNKNTPEGNITDSNDHLVVAHSTSNQNPQRQPQQQATELQTPSNTKIDNSTPSTAKIVIRIQIDGHGRLSRSYDKSVLNTRITNERFFTWFEHETGNYTCTDRLKFDFKDALPAAKSSVIARGNDDHFDLMVQDIKRKFERAKEYASDMNEFCIVVTDPEWDSSDEDGDE